MAPSLAKLAREHGDKVVVLKVDVSRQGKLAQKAGVRAIPDTRLLYKGKQLAKQVGSMPYETLVAMVFKNVGKLPPIAAATEEVAGQGAGGAAAPGEKKGNGITPMKDDWLPPGVTRD